MCVPAVIWGPAVWRHNKPRQNIRVNKQTITKYGPCSIWSGVRGPPYYCTPLVCVPDVNRVLVVWRHYRSKNKIPLLVIRYQNGVLLTIQYKYWNWFRGFYSPESDPLHKIMLYWFYYSTWLATSFPPNQNDWAEIFCTTEVPAPKGHVGRTSPSKKLHYSQGRVHCLLAWFFGLGDAPHNNRSNHLFVTVTSFLSISISLSLSLSLYLPLPFDSFFPWFLFCFVLCFITTWYFLVIVCFVFLIFVVFLHIRTSSNPLRVCLWAGHFRATLLLRITRMRS